MISTFPGRLERQMQDMPTSAFIREIRNYKNELKTYIDFEEALDKLDDREKSKDGKTE